MIAKFWLALLLAVIVLIGPLQARIFQISSRISKGETSKPNQFPYMVSLRKFNETFHGGNYRHFCGAALISDSWVISAAHCMFEKQSGARLDATDVRIVVGAYDFWRDGDIFEAMNIIRHEKYFKLTKENDIALLQTKIRIKFGENVQPIAISKELIESGQDGVLTGFGLTGILVKTANQIDQSKLKICLFVLEFGSNPNQLQFIGLRVISNEFCIRKHKMFNQVYIHGTTLCTLVGDGGGSSNQDSGGPLVINKKLVGVLSWGIPFVKGYPDQFTKLSWFTQWIQEKTGIKAV